MIVAYLVLYGGAIALATLGLLPPALIVAGCAHGLSCVPALVRVKPIRNIPG